jgi:hypothetical protein
MKSLLDDDNVLPHQSTGSKGPPLDHHQSFIGVSEGCFLGIANKLLLDANNIFSGQTTHQTKVPG